MASAMILARVRTVDSPLLRVSACPQNYSMIDALMSWWFINLACWLKIWPNCSLERREFGLQP
jgi:hypothetical protein